MGMDRLVDDLLFWAFESSEGDTTRWMKIQWWAPSSRGTSEDAVQRAVSTLMGRQLAVGKRAITHKVVEFALTPAGVREAERRFDAVSSRRERLVYAENAILTWAFETASPGRPVELLDFVGSLAGIFYGSKLTVEEVTEASTSLVELKMLTTTGGPLTGVWLAPEGRACVMSGQFVREYLRVKGTQLIQNIHSGGVGAQGLNVHQHRGNQGAGAS